jgi:hypothetical protein
MEEHLGELLNPAETEPQEYVNNLKPKRSA